MEKELDSILQILEKASKSNDVEELNQIEQQLQHSIKTIDMSYFDDVSSKNIEISDRLEKLKKLIEDNGGKVSSSISSKTNYVVAGDKMGPSKKEKAEKLNVSIISEEDFLQMIG